MLGELSKGENLNIYLGKKKYCDIDWLIRARRVHSILLSFGSGTTSHESLDNEPLRMLPKAGERSMLWLFVKGFLDWPAWMNSVCHCSSLLWHKYLKGEVTYIVLFVCLNVKGFSKAGFSYTVVNLFSHLSGINPTKINSLNWKD